MSSMWREGRETCVVSKRPADRAITRSGRQTSGIGRILCVMLLCVALIQDNQAEAAIALQQLTDSNGLDSYRPSINADGTRIAFVSVGSLNGNNPEGNPEIFLWTDGLGITQLTSTIGGDSVQPAINAGGTMIAFSSSADLIGDNADGNSEIFLWSSVSGFSQMTNSLLGSGSDSPSIGGSDEDGIVVFSSNASPFGFNPEGNYEIFVGSSSSPGMLFPLTDTPGGDSSTPAITPDVTRMVFSSNADLVGNNADGNGEIFLMGNSYNYVQLTDTPGGNSYDPRLSAGGTRIVFSSDADLVGNNPDGNEEIFLWTEGFGITQLTSTIGNSNGSPVINADGTKIAFVSTGDLTNGNADGNYEIFLWTEGLGVSQLTSTTNTLGSANPSINADGTKIAFVSTGDLTNGNADGSLEIFLQQFSDTSIILSDLTGTWLPVSQHCDGGECKLKGSVQVVNQGIATAPASRMRVFLSDDDILDSSDTSLKELKIKKLRSGRSKKSKVKVTLPLGINGSGKYVFAVIDALDSVAEINGANNVTAFGPIP